MFFPMLTKTRILPALLACGVLGTTAFAQTTPPKITGDKAQAAPYRSAFEGYSAYADDPITSWRTANETVERIGGWREYARQAQSEAVEALRPAPEVKPAVKVAP
jgi:hypothetical protein